MHTLRHVTFATFLLCLPAAANAADAGHKIIKNPEIKIEKHEILEDGLEKKQEIHEERMGKMKERREELKDRWENATPEERQAMKERREERRAKMKERWENATPEERAAMKERKLRREKMGKEKIVKHNLKKKQHDMREGEAPAAGTN